MWYPKLASAAFLLASFLLPTAALAQAPELILDNSGQLQRVLPGAYGDLFADGDAAAASTPVLAVETVAAGEVIRALVPGTEDARLEATPVLFQDPRRDAFVLLWRSQAEAGDVRLDFAAFDGAEWSEIVTLEQDGVSISADELKVVQTHDAFEFEIEDGEPIRAERLIIHILWQDDQEPPLTHYAPLTFVEGRYIGWHGTFALDEMFLQAPEEEGGENPEPTELTAALSHTFELRVSSDSQSVQLTFANSSSNRIGSLKISPLPLEIGLLGDNVRDHILALADLYDPDDLSLFSDGIRAGMVIIGQRFNLHDAHAGYVADQVADWILDSGESYGWAGLENLGDDARDLAIDVSQEVYVSAGADSADPDSEIVRLDVSGLFGPPEESDPMQIFDFRIGSDRPAPEIDERPVDVFTSRHGGDLLVAWHDEDGEQIQWVESLKKLEDGAWSEIFSLPLGEQLTLEAAHRLLARRIR